MQNVEEKNGKMVAVYIRVSTGKESQDDSFESQLEMIERKIQENGYTIYEVYKERVTATKVTGREAFERMINDAKRGKFDAIYAKDLSRIARNQEVAHRLIRIVKENGIELITLSEGGRIEDNVALFSVHALVNEQLSADLSKKIKLALRNKAAKGEYTRMEPPYGYFVKDKKLFIRADGVPEVVKRIFHLYLVQGHGVDAIARRIESEGIIPPGLLKGKVNAGIRWHGSSIKYILTNPAYVGDLVQNREETVYIGSSKRKKIDNPIIVKNTHEAIISRETFVETQRLMEKRRRGPRPTPKKHLFTDILYCGKCGKKYWFRKDECGNNNHRYICGAYAKYGKKVCAANSVTERKITEIIKKDLKKLLKENNVKNLTGKEVENIAKKKTYEMKKKKEILNARLEKFEEKKAEQYVLKVMEDITEEQYELFTKAADKQTKEIIEELKKLEDLSLGIMELKAQERTKSAFLGITDFDTITRRTIDMFIEKITIKGKTRIEIFYKFRK
ncbi:MAG: hypothetical protein COA82_08260 [Alkaliphilus sp.]|nr:MAG: hypothetical protein COA82_08260 [Alkaliphilus sp.]